MHTVQRRRRPFFPGGCRPEIVFQKFHNDFNNSNFDTKFQFSGVVLNASHHIGASLDIYTIQSCDSEKYRSQITIIHLVYIRTDLKAGILIPTSLKKKSMFLKPFIAKHWKLQLHIPTSNVKVSLNSVREIYHLIRWVEGAWTNYLPLIYETIVKLPVLCHFKFQSVVRSESFNFEISA